MAAKTTDADGAKAIFRDLIAAGLPCTPDMCAMFLHIYCEAQAKGGDSSGGGGGGGGGGGSGGGGGDGGGGTTGSSSARSADLLSEALAVFSAAKACGSIPTEPAWSGLVKLHCLQGEGLRALEQVDAMGKAKCVTAAAHLLPDYRGRVRHG